MKKRAEVQPDVFVIGMCRVVAGPAKADGVVRRCMAAPFHKIVVGSVVKSKRRTFTSSSPRLL
jgi:hypothetical protein